MMTRTLRATIFSIALVSILFLGACGQDPESDNELVVDSWGGDFQSAQSEIYFSPFQAEAGTKIVQLSDGENIYAKLQAQAARPTGEIDLVHGDASWLMRGRQDHLWAKIDYAALGDVKLYEDARDDYGVGILYWSFNVVFNSAAVSEAPKTWADVWNYAKAHPNRVAMWNARPNYVLEAALMATGIEPSAIYPLTPEKIDRAYAKLDEIKTKVLWYESGAQGSRLFEEGQVDMGMFYGGDAFGVKVNGTPLSVVWNQGLYTRDYWLVPANAPHKDQAMRLIKFALQANRQAQFAERTGYGPVVPDAIAQISASTQTRLASVEPQKSLQLSYDYEWWGANDDAQLARWTTWLRG